MGRVVAEDARPLQASPEDTALYSCDVPDQVEDATGQMEPHFAAAVAPEAFSRSGPAGERLMRSGFRTVWLFAGPEQGAAVVILARCWLGR